MKKEEKEKSTIEPVESEVLQQQAQVEQQEESPVEQTEEEEVVDDPTAVKLTVLVVCTELDSKLLRYALRSLANLRGIDAEIKVTGTEKPDWLPHEDFIFVEGNTYMLTTIFNALQQIKSERVVLMTDHTFIVNPVSFADIAINKALPERPSEKESAVKILNALDFDNRIENYRTHTPLYVFKSQLVEVLSAMVSTNIRTDDFATVYCNLMYRDIKPLYLSWRNDQWVIPVISQNPNKKDVLAYAKKKKFLYMQQCNEHLLDILATLFPTPCEAEIPDENNE